jgi:LssY C-terminus
MDRRSHDRSDLLRDHRGGWPIAILWAIMLVAGCGSFRPTPLSEVPFLARAVAQEKGKVRVTVAVPTAEESARLFGVPVAAKGIQPVWLRIENHDTVPYWLIALSLDPDYFSPQEVAYLHHFRFSLQTNQAMGAYFEAQQIRSYLPPGAVNTGFVYTNLVEAAKYVNVDLWHDNGLVHFGFFVPVPGGTFDYELVDFDRLYARDQITSLELHNLREVLERLPCCTTNAAGGIYGDPLNLVVVGHEDDVFAAFVRRNWDATHALTTRKAARTVGSFLFGGRYRYSPVSPLYVYGRPQDIALQKARSNIHQRNHLRLWLSPFTSDGKAVWVGQISRDIGVRFTTRSALLTTHTIDPDVDEAREYVMQDIFASQSLAALAYVKGVGAAARHAPRVNLTGDAYFTDGLRLVLFISDQPTDAAEVDYVEWEAPVER